MLSGTSLQQTTLGPADSVLFREVPASNMSFMERLCRSTTQKIIHSSMVHFVKYTHITLQVYKYTLHYSARQLWPSATTHTLHVPERTWRGTYTTSLQVNPHLALATYTRGTTTSSATQSNTQRLDTSTQFCLMCRPTHVQLTTEGWL